MPPIFHFGSETGSNVAFIFVVLIALVIGWSGYALLTRRGARRARFRRLPTAKKPLAAVVACALVALVFGLVYLQTIYGFHHLTVENDTLRLDYVLPRHSVRVPLVEIAKITREAGHRRSWRLVVYTEEGARYRSAQASNPDVEKAREHLQKLSEPSR